MITGDAFFDDEPVLVEHKMDGTHLAATWPSAVRAAYTPKRLPNVWDVLNTFVDVTTVAKELTPWAVVVWMILWRDTDRKTGLATSAQTYIGRRGRLSDRQVRRAIVELEEKSLLTVVSRGGNKIGGGKRLSVYRLHHE